jgi:Methyltransferase domain
MVPSMETKLRAVIGDVQTAAGALAALGAALGERRPAPPLGERIDEVLDVLGVRAEVAALPDAERRALAAELRTLARANASVLEHPDAEPGWSPVAAAMMHDAGAATAGLATRLARAVVPELEDLGTRLASRGAAFLDVGTGVAALAIAMARAWPALAVVGVDPWPHAVALARSNVHAAGLDDRITIREGGAETLTEHGAFDLAWVPTLFVPDGALHAIFARVQRALRRGGWLVLPGLSDHAPPLTRAVAHLRTASWGGCSASAPELARRLAQHGYVAIRVLAAPQGSSSALVVARKP